MDDVPMPEIGPNDLLIQIKKTSILTVEAMLVIPMMITTALRIQ